MAHNLQDVAQIVCGDKEAIKGTLIALQGLSWNDMYACDHIRENT